MNAGPWFDRYEWDRGAEAILRFGPATGPTIIVAPPLFEEANRTRALIVAVLRGLAARGIAGALPDLPGQGESETDLADVRVADWRDAFARAVARIQGMRFVFAIRGGALVTEGVAAVAQLHCAPVAGTTLVRDLMRARRVAALAAGERPTTDDFAAPGPPVLLAGNLIGRNLLRDLTGAVPAEADRTITPDAIETDHCLSPMPPGAGSNDRPRLRAPWLASEPSVDHALVAMLVDAISAWVRGCAGC